MYIPDEKFHDLLRKYHSIQKAMADTFKESIKAEIDYHLYTAAELAKLQGLDYMSSPSANEVLESLGYQVKKQYFYNPNTCWEMTEKAKQAGAKQLSSGKILWPAHISLKEAFKHEPY